MTIAEFWKERYEVVVAEKKALGEKLGKSLEENKDLKEQLDKSIADRSELQADRDIWFRKNGEKLAEIEELKEQLDKANADRSELQADRDAYHGLYTELKKDYDRLFEEVRALKMPGCPSLEELRKDLDDAKNQLKYFTNSRDEWRGRAKHAEKQLEELKKKVESLEADLKSALCSRDTWRAEAERLRKEITESYSDGYSDGNEEGQNELWEMLQLVRDMQPNEFDVECECLGDVIDMDLEDFKEAYGKWEAEQKKAADEAKKQHVEYMRDYLKRYCIGKLCFGCPLYNASEPVSSCLFSKLTDEEVEKKYRKVVDSEWEKAPRYFRSTIETVFTAEAKINKDLLKDICGIKPKEEEHKLEYGDAVRLPWRDYDYMYIAPDEKEETLVHLFDPENHAIVTTHISNVRYNGGRILVAEEDDIIIGSCK